MDKRVILKLLSALALPSVLLTAVFASEVVTTSDTSEVAGAEIAAVSGQQTNPEVTAQENVEAESIPVAADIPGGKKLDVPFINQRNGFPNGCESVSAVMALQYAGIDVTATGFVKDYLDMGNAPYWKNGILNACDPREFFPGDPRLESGWGCYPQVIKNAIDKMELEGYEAVVLKDASLSTLCSEYIDNGIPVVFWGTIDMAAPSPGLTWKIEQTEDFHTWIQPFHCLLLVGYDDEYYYFNDPWRKKDAAYSAKAVEISYSGIGREALVIVEK